MSHTVKWVLMAPPTVATAVLIGIALTVVAVVAVTGALAQGLWRSVT